MHINTKPQPSHDDYRSSHWTEKNVLAHVRFNDRTDANGDKVLFIEEIQSDWHQEGRKRGYLNKGRELPEGWAVKLRGDGGSSYWAVYDAEGKNISMKATKEEAIDAALKSRLVPDAPFKTTWPEFVLKRMLRYAAENGYDSIAWTTGEQQAERYDLSKQVDNIAYASNPDGSYDISAAKGGGRVFHKENVPLNQVEDLVGKEIATKIKNGEGTVRVAKSRFGSNQREWYVLSGLDLKIGGEGMKGFYDRMLPAFLNKYAKKWGAKVEQATLDAEPAGTSTYDYEKTTNGTGKYEIFDAVTGRAIDWVSTEDEAKAYIKRLMQGEEYTVHSLPITDAMRRSVLQGQPKFKGERKPIPEAYRNFVSRALETRGQFDTYTVGRVNADDRAKIAEVAQIDVKGYSHDIANYDLQHMINEHGNPDVEGEKGNMALTEDDLLEIPNIIKYRDSIEAGKVINGVQGIIYKKRVNGVIYYVEQILTGKQRLRSKTMWKIVAAADHAALEAPPLSTSETGPRLNSSTKSNITPYESGSNIPETNGKDKPHRQPRYQFPVRPLNNNNNKTKVNRKAGKPPGPDTSAHIASKLSKGSLKERFSKSSLKTIAGKLYGLIDISGPGYGGLVAVC